MSEEKKVEELSFEEAMSELDALVRASESGGIPLDDMLKRLKRGNELAGFCRSKLTELERRIEILVRDGDKPQWAEFDAEKSSREN